jgi:hypothetical protein
MAVGKFGAALVAMLTAAGCVLPVEEEVEGTEQALLHGTFSRQSYSEAPAQHQEWATAVGVLVLREDLTYLGGACANPATGTNNDCTVLLDSMTATERVNQGLAPLCAHGVNANLDPNDEQMRRACTTFMIGPDTFVTAGHCIFPDGVPFTAEDQEIECAKRSVVLRWRPSDNAEFPNGNPSVLERHVYHCTDVIAHGQLVNGWLVPQDARRQNNDWAVFTVDRDVTGGTGTGGPLTPAREPLVLASAAPDEDTEGLTIGHPYGQPTKIDPEVSVSESPNFRGHGLFTWLGDGNRGMSGGPVLDEAGTVMGIVQGGPVFAQELDPRFPAPQMCDMECYAPSDGRTPVCPDEFGDGDFEAYAVGAHCIDHDIPGNDEFCTEDCPCNAGMGDCDNAAECAPGLICRKDIGAGYRLPKGHDVCVPSSCGDRALGSDDYCNDGCACGYGSGDCDSRSGRPTCMAGMVCASDYGPAFKMKPSTDVCTLPQCAGRTLGAGSFCTDECPCGHGGTDCNDDDDCLPGLVCAQNVGEAFNAGTNSDVCMPSTCAARALGTDNEYCSTGCPCGHGGGDCDEDAECMPDHVCGRDNGPTFGYPAGWDVCVRR